MFPSTFEERTESVDRPRLAMGNLAFEVQEDAPLLPLRLERDRDESLPVETVIAIEWCDRVVNPIDYILEIGFGSDRIAVAVGDEIGFGREARRVAGRASGRGVVQVVSPDVDVPLARICANQASPTLMM